MRYLTIPDAVSLGKTTLSFEEFLDQVAYDAMRKKNFDLFDSITEKMEGAAAGGVVAITDAEHELLEQVLDAANLNSSRVLKPFFRAVKKAPKKEPAKPPSPAASSSAEVPDAPPT